MALNRKIVYIDLTTGAIEVKPIPLDVRRKFPVCGPAGEPLLSTEIFHKGCSFCDVAVDKGYLGARSVRQR